MTSTGAQLRSHGALAEAHAASADASAITSCTVDADGLSLQPGGSHGEAYGTGYVFCYPPVTSDEVWIALESYWTSDHEWHAETTGPIDFGGPGIYTYADDSYACKQPGERAWAAVAVAYATGDGHTEGATNTIYNNLNCVG